MKSALVIVIHFLSFGLLAFAYTAAFTNPIELAGGQEADPTKNEIYTVGDSINVTWTTDAPDVDLVIWQDSSDSTSASIGSLQYMPGSTHRTQQWYLWNIQTNGTPSFDLTVSNLFAFSLYYPGEGSPIANSAWFNLTNSTVDAQGHVHPTSTAKPSPTSSSTSQTLPPSNSASPSSSASPSPTTVSKSNKTAIGVGVGIGVPAFLAVVAGVVWLMMRKRKPQYTAHTPAAPDGAYYSKAELDGNEVQKKHGEIYELPPQFEQIHELPGTRYTDN